MAKAGDPSHCVPAAGTKGHTATTRGRLALSSFAKSAKLLLALPHPDAFKNPFFFFFWFLQINICTENEILPLNLKTACVQGKL